MEATDKEVLKIKTISLKALFLRMIILKLRVNLFLYITSQLQRKVIAKSRGYEK